MKEIETQLYRILTDISVLTMKMIKLSFSSLEERQLMPKSHSQAEILQALPATYSTFDLKKFISGSSTNYIF